ncbi:MAG: hypothetical protein ABGX47_07125 [Martelella sp.]|uniref:hypothetical protein n=1 Tax=Martelella sp. TaxID=1969699 RepID=UPI003242BE11
MGWEEMRFRVVTRNADDKIIDDRLAPHFAGAKPIYDSIAPKPGELVTLQHGIRIVKAKNSQGIVQ